MNSAPAGGIGIAVSGGGDSMALLVMMIQWAHESQREVFAVTVDHGLRPEATAEAEFVAAFSAQQGVSHTTLRWQGWDGKGNLQNAARLARRGLIGDWARERGLQTLVTGHTKDDQAETFLMRLARGSGVDGLAGMHQQERVDGQLWLRPLLSVGRASLRDYLQSRNISWREDPSNQDEKYTRIKFRKAMDMLTELGLGVDLLSETAQRMQMARHALELTTLATAQQVATPRASGVVRVNSADLAKAAPEIQLRLLAHALVWVSGTPYRPRLKSLLRLQENLKESQTQSLAGCLVANLGDNTVEISREPNAMRETSVLNALYDGRWQVECATEKTPLTLRPLGEAGIVQRPEWRQSAETRLALLSSPSIWYNNELMSAPMLDKDGPCTCKLHKGAESFYLSILTH